MRESEVFKTVDAHSHCGCGASPSFLMSLASVPASCFDWDAQQGQLVAQHPQDLQVSVLLPVGQQVFGQHVGGQHASLLTFSGILQQQVAILIDI